MRKILALLLILLVAGCIQPEEIKEKGFDIVKDKLGVEIGVAKYDMKVGDSVTVDNKQIILESFNPDYVVVFDVDGQKREMKETQDPQIVQGVEITIKAFRYDASDIESNYVKVDIVKYVPEEDEYLFYLNDVKQVLGHSIELTNLDKDGTITVGVNGEEVRVMENGVGDVLDIYISNVRPNFRAINNQRYAIVKVVLKP